MLEGIKKDIRNSAPSIRKYSVSFAVLKYHDQPAGILVPELLETARSEGKSEEEALAASVLHLRYPEDSLQQRNNIRNELRVVLQNALKGRYEEGKGFVAPISKLRIKEDYLHIIKQVEGFTVSETEDITVDFSLGTPTLGKGKPLEQWLHYIASWLSVFLTFSLLVAILPPLLAQGIAAATPLLLMGSTFSIWKTWAQKKYSNDSDCFDIAEMLLREKDWFFSYERGWKGKLSYSKALKTGLFLVVITATALTAGIAVGTSILGWPWAALFPAAAVKLLSMATATLLGSATSVMVFLSTLSPIRYFQGMSVFDNQLKVTPEHLQQMLPKIVKRVRKSAKMAYGDFPLEDRKKLDAMEELAGGFSHPEGPNKEELLIQLSNRLSTALGFTPAEKGIISDKLQEGFEACHHELRSGKTYSYLYPVMPSHAVSPAGSDNAQSSSADDTPRRPRRKGSPHSPLSPILTPEGGKDACSMM